MVTEDGLDALGLIAGKGVYPLELARSARAQGIMHLVAVAFRKETDPSIKQMVDEVIWLRVGQLEALLESFHSRRIRQVVMAGQITPTHLFRARPDKAMLQLLAGLTKRNAHTIFGAVGEALKEIDVELKPASMFMESAMPDVGTLSSRVPTRQEQQDIGLGMDVARMTSSLDIGQTVVIKEGTILAVEAFEGTDATIRRAGKLGGRGAVIVKVAKSGHDMRFDIPVIGEQTLHILKKVKASVLAVQARRSILLNRVRLIEMADAQGMCLTAVDMAEQPTGVE